MQNISLPAGSEQRLQGSMQWQSSGATWRQQSGAGGGGGHGNARPQRRQLMCITLQTPKTGLPRSYSATRQWFAHLGPQSWYTAAWGRAGPAPAAPGARRRCAASMQSKNDPEGSCSSCSAAAADAADAGGAGLAAPHYWEEEIFRGNELSAECRRVTHSGEGSAAATVPNAGRRPLAPPPSACAPDRRAGCLALQRRPGLLWADRAAPHAAGRGGGCALVLTAAECAACRMRLSRRATARACR